MGGQKLTPHHFANNGQLSMVNIAKCDRQWLASVVKILGVTVLREKARHIVANFFGKSCGLHVVYFRQMSFSGTESARK